MKKNILLSVLVFAFVIAVNGADKLNRITRGIQVTGGTNSTSGSTLVTSDSSTNEFTVVQATATQSGAATSATVTFAKAFTATPTVTQGMRDGSAVASDTVTTSATTTNLVVTGLNSSTLNSVKFLIYGTRRSGVFE